MQILVVSRRRTEAFPEAQFAALLDEEAEALRSLYAAGIVRAAWTREDVLGACMMVEAPGLEEARHELDALPLMSRGMLEAQFIPLRGYRGFGPRNP